jgi:hypothetical protein
MATRLIGHLVRVERSDVVLGELHDVIVRDPTSAFLFLYGDGLLSTESAVVVTEVDSLQLNDFLDVAFEITWAKNGSHELTVTKFGVNLKA